MESREQTGKREIVSVGKGLAAVGCGRCEAAGMGLIQELGTLLVKGGLATLMTWGLYLERD